MFFTLHLINKLPSYLFKSSRESLIRFFDVFMIPKHRTSNDVTYSFFFSNIYWHSIFLRTVLVFKKPTIFTTPKIKYKSAKIWHYDGICNFVHVRSLFASWIHTVITSPSSMIFDSNIFSYSILLGTTCL